MAQFPNSQLKNFREAEKFKQVGLTKKILISVENPPENSNKIPNSQLPYIILGVVGAVALIALVGLLVGLRMRKQRKSNRMQQIRIPRPIHIIPPNDQKSYQNFA